MAKNVVAFVGQNAHRILEYQSRRFMDLLPPGLTGHVINLASPGATSRLAELMTEGVLFGWGYAGVGARLGVNGENLWQNAKTPFISVLADAPFIMPLNHSIAASYVVNGYVFRDWLDLQQAMFRSQQISALLPMGVIPNPDAHNRWSERPNRMVLVKAGSDPVRQRELWDAWPGKLRTILHDCADVLTPRETCAVYPAVKAVLDAHGLVLDGVRSVLFGVLHEMDTYIRGLRAFKLVQALLPLPVDIIGNGWDHIRQSEGKARFHPPVDASTLEGLYAQTQILVNASPCFGSGAHERVLRGFAARCRVASDMNEHARQNLAALPSYAGFEWNDPHLADRLASICYDETCFDDRLDEALDYVGQHHDPHAFLAKMVDLAATANLQRVMSGYAVAA